MDTPEKLEKGLGVIIAAICAGQQSSAQTKHLIHTCHAMAGAFIGFKLGSGAFTKKWFGLRVHDIALDCIGDIFAHDEQGRIPELISYFHDCDGLTDAEVLSLLRRLVFSKVNHGIYRLYKEIDPELARIIRNIKLSLVKSTSVVQIERFGDVCIAPANVPLQLHLQMMEPDTLAHLLGGKVSIEEHIPEFISITGRCLREQDDYARAVPIVTLALVHRSLFQDPDSSRADKNEGEETLNRTDLRHIINHLCGKLKAENKSWYVEHKQIHPQVYQAYWLTIQHNLINRLVEEDGTEASMSKLFQRFAPHVPMAEYQKTHRARIEYLAAKVMTGLVEATKNG